MTSRNLSIVIALALLAAAGLADRWLRYSRAHSQPLAFAIGRVKALPDRLGNWDGHAVEVDQALVKTSLAHASRIALFQDHQSGQKVNFAVLASYPGLVTDHLPEQGFSAIGLTLETGSIRRHKLAELTDGRVHGELVSMDFRDPRSAEPVRVWQGWYDGKSWSRPDWARVRFATLPALYQFQVWSYLVRDPLSDDPAALSDPGRKFLVETLAELTSRLGEPGSS